MINNVRMLWASGCKKLNLTGGFIFSLGRKGVGTIVLQGCALNLSVAQFDPRCDMSDHQSELVTDR